MNNQHDHFSKLPIDYQNPWGSDINAPQDLIVTKKCLYDPCKMITSVPVMEPESVEYGAFIFKVNDFVIRFRVAKITSTKTGQFVTLWKRSVGGPIQPFDVSDLVDFFVISVRKDKNLGQFVFPKSILCEKDIFSINSKGGKRAIRVYPPWDETTNKQAKKTQAWQMNYFLEIPHNRSVDCSRAKFLYSAN